MENSKFNPTIIFPEIFITGELPRKWTRESLISDGLCGWANCMCGTEPPKNFGKGMSLISGKVGSATPDGLDRLANELLTKK